MFVYLHINKNTKILNKPYHNYLTTNNYALPHIRISG